MESKRLTAGPTFLSILYKYNVSWEVAYHTLRKQKVY
jgi:hypothetical protein